jgi:4-carboxymuconolactone decarboxylase
MTHGLSQPRIAPRPDDRDPAPLNIFRTLSRNEKLSKSFLALGSHLLLGDVLPEREREIVILRVGWRSGSEYEFGQHTVMGEKAGLTIAEIERLASGDLDEWAAGDVALIRLADELCEDNTVSDATWAELASRWDEAQLLELVMLAGFYRMVSGMLNAVGVPLEPATPGWPTSAGPSRRAPRESPA